MCLGQVKPVSQVASHRGWALGVLQCVASSPSVLTNRMTALGLQAAGFPQAHTVLLEVD